MRSSVRAVCPLTPRMRTEMTPVDALLACSAAHASETASSTAIHCSGTAAPASRSVTIRSPVPAQPPFKLAVRPAVEKQRRRGKRFSPWCGRGGHPAVGETWETPSSHVSIETTRSRLASRSWPGRGHAHAHRRDAGTAAARLLGAPRPLQAQPTATAPAPHRARPRQIPGKEPRRTARRPWGHCSHGGEDSSDAYSSRLPEFP
jgi:hypothetical protein